MLRRNHVEARMIETVEELAARGWQRDMVGGFSALVGPIWRRDTDDGPRYAFTIGEHHLNGNGVVHGGMLMTFIDQSIGWMVWRAIDRAPCATIQLNSHFVDAGRHGDFVEAHTEIVRRTASLLFTRGHLTAGGRTLLSADGIWKVLRASANRPPPQWD
jgi:acyl-coenzyme A thioesterase PaaI-like protein